MKTVAFVVVFAICFCLPQPASAQVSRTCQLMVPGIGPPLKVHFPAAMPVPVGSPCQDGMGHFGTAIPDAMGNSCRFLSGTFAGHTVNYDWIGLLTIGLPCQDGMGGSGFVEYTAPPFQTSQTCRLLIGPKAGQIEKFPNITPARWGVPCWDGQSSFGLVVPDATGVPVNAWNGDPTPGPEVQTGDAPVAMGGSALTPLSVAKSCILSNGYNEAALLDCAAKNMPDNMIQQCATNCNACFGKFDLNNYSCRMVTGVAKKVGVNLPAVAKKIDKVWGKVKKLF